MNRNRNRRQPRCPTRSGVKAWALVAVLPLAAGSAALPIAPPDRREPVDFEREILPVFNANCLACHNQTKAKAGLILETPAAIRQGGDSGSAIVPGNPGESLLFRAAAHLDDTVMPPTGNQSNAKNLTPEQLGLLQRWIAEGARGEVSARLNIAWQPVNRRVRPIYATALTPSGQYAAYGIGSEAVVYEIPSRKVASRLRDPHLSGRRSHQDLVNAIAFHPAGDWIATGGFREVKLWKRETRGETFSLEIEPGDQATAVGLSGNRLTMALGLRSGRVKTWEISTGTLLLDWPWELGAVKHLSLSEDGSRVAIIFEAGRLRAITFDGENVFEAQTPEAPNARLSCWSRSGNRLAVAIFGGTVEVWKRDQAAKFERERTIQGEEIVGLAGSANGGYLLAVAERRGRVRLFDWQTGRLQSELDLKNPASQWILSNGGKRFVAAMPDGHAALWDAISGEQTAVLRGARKTQKQLDEKERLLRLLEGAVALAKKEIESTAKELKKETERTDKAETDLAAKKTEVEQALEKQKAAQKAHEAATEKVNQLSNQLAEAEQTLKTAQLASEEAADEAKQLAKQLRETLKTATAAESNIETLHQKLNQALEKLASRAFAAGQSKSHLKQITSDIGERKKKAAEQADAAQKALAKEEANLIEARRVLSLAENELKLAKQSVEYLTTQSRKAEQSLKEAEASAAAGRQTLADAQSRLQAALVPFRTFDFSPDGKRIAALESSGDLSVWWAETGDELESVSLSSSNWIATQFLTDRSILTLAEDGIARIVALDGEWMLHRTLGEEFGFVGRVNALDFSADGKWLTSGGGEPSRSGEIKVWNWETMELVKDFPKVHSDAVFGLEFSPDAKFLASGSADRFVRIVALDSGKTAHSFEGHTHHVMDVSWQADGRTLASAGGDGVIKIWDTATGERKKNIDGFKKEVTGVGFIGGRAEVLASSGDATIAVYGLDGKRLRVMEGALGFVFAESVSADGRYIAAGGRNGALRIWDARSGKAWATVAADRAE